MKIYSDDSISKADVDARALEAAKVIGNQVMLAVNTKQDRQIMQLRVALAVVFVVNLVIALVF